MTLDTQQTITNAKIFRSGQQPLRLVADTTGGAVFLPFYDADGTTRKGWIGRGSANNNTIQLNNDATGASIQLSDTGGINITPTSNGAIETRGLLKNVNPGFSGIALESTSIAANTVGRIFKIETSSDGLSVVFIARNGSNTTGQRTASLALPAASGNILVSNGNAVADANGSWIVPGSAGSISVNDLAGIPLPFPGAVAPAGWLKCNGQTFNKTLYPVLASRYPAGILPDLRGEFVRGWDDGRGADAGRALLSVQGDAIRNITGRLLYGYDADTGVAADADSGALHYDTTQGVRDSLYLTWATNTANLWYPAKLDASRVVPTANENRSRNVAFNYIVRAA
ncbi:hypothetical protein F164LOC_17325 [Pectobacterium carotovorum]|nr:hypothetical protein F164LOC_17325 [Pectobacterium carotovorum]